MADSVGHLALCAILAVVATGSQVSAQAQGEAVNGTLTRVVLYSSGTGYFEYTAEVDGYQTVRIALDDQDLNDVLKTLMVEDTSGGKIRSVDYDRTAGAHFG